MDPKTIAHRHRARASAALEIGRFNLAEREARQALAIDPRDVDSHLYLARAYLGLAHYEEAATAAESAIVLVPDASYAYYLQGFALQAGGKTLRAIEALREAIRLNPHAARFHARLAIALVDQKDHAGARACIDTALTLDPENPSLLDEASRVYGVIGPLRRAEELARKVIVRLPDTAVSHWRLAWVLGLQKRYEEGVGSAQAALRIDPNNWPAWEELGYALFQLQRTHDAEHALREALRLKPALHSAGVNLVNLLLRQRRYREAADVCTQVLAADPRNARIDQLRGIARQGVADERQRRLQQRVTWVGLAVMLAVLIVRAMPAGWPTVAGTAVAVLTVVALTWWLWFSKSAAQENDPGQGTQ